MWIDTIPPDEAVGLLRERYDEQAAALGRPTEITMLGSLYPELVDVRMRLYQVVEACPSQLSPLERQGIALAAVSRLGSGVLSSGVRGKFLRQGGTVEQAERLERGEPALSVKANALADYAARVAIDPASLGEGDVLACRTAGASDLEILDANSLAAYYSYLARVCLGLGLRG